MYNPTGHYTMSKDDYRKAIREIGLNQAHAAWLFNGYSDTQGRTGRRWATEGAPYHVALIIELMRLYDITPDQLAAIGSPWRKPHAAKRPPLPVRNRPPFYVPDSL
jgi:hypothetical protein